MDDLWAAMDALDQRVVAALAAAREANAAGLGRVRGLTQTKSMRLRAPGAGSQAEEVVDDEAYSPRALLGAEAAEQPDKFLPRVKFSFQAQVGPPLHEGGCSTARGRLEGNGDDVPEAAGLIAAVHQGGSAAGAGSAEQQQQQQQQPADQPPPGAAAPADAQRPHGVRWGATEGGLDRLGWVRNLVQFSEFKQQQGLLAQPAGVPPPGGQSPDQLPAGMSTISWLESGAGLNPGGSTNSGGTAAGQGRPAPPRSREEVALLQAWLQDMMGQVIAQAGGQQPQRLGAMETTADAAAAAVAAVDVPGSQQAQPQSAADLADAALWVYGLAFEELQRQVGTECGDRGTLLGGMWQHTFSLVELR